MLREPPCTGGLGAGALAGAGPGKKGGRHLLRGLFFQKTSRGRLLFVHRTTFPGGGAGLASSYLMPRSVCSFQLVPMLHLSAIEDGLAHRDVGRWTSLFIFQILVILFPDPYPSLPPSLPSIHLSVYLSIYLCICHLSIYLFLISLLGKFQRRVLWSICLGRLWV